MHSDATWNTQGCTIWCQNKALSSSALNSSSRDFCTAPPLPCPAPSEGLSQAGAWYQPHSKQPWDTNCNRCHLCLWATPAVTLHVAFLKVHKGFQTHRVISHFLYMSWIFNLPISGITDLVRSHFILNLQLCKDNSSSARIKCEL